MKALKRFIIPIIIFIFSLFLQYGLHPLDIFKEAWVFRFVKLGEVLLIAGFAWALIVLINMGKNRFLQNFDIGEADNLKTRKLYTQYNIIEKIVVFIIILVSTGFALMLFDGVRNIGLSLFASAGIAGLILGFAAQKALGTILAGIQIAITQPIRIDDVVIVEN